VSQQHTAKYIFIKHSNSIAISILYLLTLWTPFFVQAQTESPLIRNYSSKEYHSAGSNFDAVQDANGILYFANFDGVLVYDGKTWELIEIANGKTAHSLAIQDNKLFVGSHNEMGYISWDAKGKTVYKSLTDNIIEDFGIVVKIVPDGQKLFFNTRKALFEYNFSKVTDRIRLWRTERPNLFYKGSFVKNGAYFIHKTNKGLFKLDHDSLKIVKGQELLTHETYIYSSEENNGVVDLFGTTSGNTYKFNRSSDSSILVNNSSSDLPSSLSINAASINSKNESTNLTIGTLRKGIYYLNNGKLAYNINEQNGLISNNIRSLLLGTSQNTWSASRDGISKIDNISKWSLWAGVRGVEGTITDIIKHDSSIYLSTFKGIFGLNNTRFEKVDYMSQRAMSFFELNETPYSNTEFGLKKPSDPDYIHALPLPTYSKQIDSNKILTHLVLQGLVELQYNAKTETFGEQKVIDSSAKGVTSNGLIIDSTYWFSIKNSGLFNYDLSEQSKIYKFTEKHGLPDVVEPFIFNYKGKLLFATGSGFYKLNPTPHSDSSDIFIPDSTLISERIGIRHPVTDTRGNIWYEATYGKSNTYIEKLALQNDGSYLKETRPFKRLPQQGYSKIYPDPEEEGMIWIAGTEGLYRYNDNIEVDYDIPFNTLVRKVHTRDSLIFAGTYFDPSDTAVVPSMLLDQSETFKPALIYADNQIRFDFTATSYEVPEKNQYSYRLKGNEKEWSAWSLETKKEYTNLRPGIYTFLVKSKNIYDTIGRTASYEFAILPPWWMTYWAYALYIILAVFIFWVTTLIYTYRIRVQRRKLKLIVADRTYEVLMQSKEIEKKNSLLIEQTEEITQQRDDISEKNQELESSQEEIMAINSRLKELNDHLEMQVDMRTKKIKSTLVQLRKTNKELDTFIYRASHDLKSPISRIMGLSTLAKLEMPDDMNREYFNLIELAANDMKKLLSKLTQVHEMLNKKVVIKEIDVPTLLSSIRESLKHLDRDSNIKYTFNIKDQLSLESDADIIRVIIENLVENAIIFRKEDSKERHHIITQLFEKDDMIHIIVRDNGQGIASELHNKLYDMFFRGSDNSKGTGLGLYLVKMAVENLEGTITLDSKPNEFTEFTVQLPIMNR